MPVTDSTAPARRVRVTIIAFMVALSVMSYVDRTVMSVAGPVLITQFGLSEVQMGSVYSAFILSYALLMAPGGWLADRYGARIVLALTGAGAALCTALTVVAGGVAWMGIFPALLVIRFALGAFAAPLYPACGRVTADWVPETKRARAQGLIIAGAPLGGALTPALFVPLIAAYGWRSAFYIAAAATALLSLIWYWYVRDHPCEHPSIAATGPRRVPESRAPQAREMSSADWRGLLANRSLWLLTLGYFTVNYFEYIFFYWIYYYFGEVRGLGREASAVYTTVLLLTMMAMTPLGGWVADRLAPRYGTTAGRRLVSVTGMALSAGLLYLGVSLTSTFAVVILLALALGFCASTEGPYWAAAIEAGGAQAGTAGGILNAVGNLGGLLAPVLTPYIASLAGWAWGLYFAGFLILTGAVSWLLIAPEKRIAAQEQPT